MHISEFQPKHDLLVSIKDDAHNARIICIESNHPGHDWDTCPHEDVFWKACQALDKLWDTFLSTPDEERYA